MSAPLSHELTASKGAKTLPVRKGDTILIKRGDNKGFEGKVSRVDLKAYRIYIEGLTREKVDGTNIFLPIHPSKVEIRNLNLDDKWRKNILERKKATAQPAKPKAKLTRKAEKPVKVISVKEKVAPEVPEKQSIDVAAEEPLELKKSATKKEAKPKAAAKKELAANKTEEKEATPKPRAKSKTSEKTKGEQ
jgi:large subunit ribosomal protein L24